MSIESATPICICVDDFGLHPAINQAVLALADARRISATSAMVGGSAWDEGAAQLRALGSASPIEVGLHLDFTEPAIHDGEVRMPLRSLILASYARRLDPAQLRREISRQLDAFEARLQRPPAYVDGHQHVHQLPQVREALLAVLNARYPAEGPRPWLRSTWPRPGLVGSVLANPKAAVIAVLGAYALRQQAGRHGFAFNGALFGVYDFAGDAARYARLLREWLTQMHAADVLMCHPAAAAVLGDAIAAARTTEFEVLRSPAFAELLLQSRRVPGPMGQHQA